MTFDDLGIGRYYILEETPESHRENEYFPNPWIVQVINISRENNLYTVEFDDIYDFGTNALDYGYVYEKIAFESVIQIKEEITKQDYPEYFI